MQKIKKLLPMLLTANFIFPTVSAYASDITLEEAVSMAIRNNGSIHAIQEGENAARAAFEAAKGESGVAVSIRDGISFSKQEGNDFTSSNAVSINGQYSLYNGGKTKNNIESSKMGINIAQLQTEKAKNDLVMNVTKAYYNVLEAKDSITVNQESVDNYNAHLENVKNLYDAGAKAKVDVLRTEVELANAKQNLTKAELNYVTRMAQLKNYMRLDNETPIELVSVADVESIPESIEDFQRQAISNRPELRIDWLKVKQAELNLESTKAEYKPTVNLSAGFSRDDSFTDNHRGSTGFSSGVSVNWNVFDNGITKARATEKEALLNSAKYTLQNDIQGVYLDVRTAYYGVNEAISRFDATRAAIAKAGEDYRIALLKYTAGEGLLVDVIDAQTALTTARQNYFNAQYDFVRNRAELYHAVGLYKEKN